MKILVSACLLGENCKYNGKNNENEKVLDLAKDHDLIPVCPEVLGGLPTPRPPSEIVDGEVISKEGYSVHDKFLAGAEKALEIALEKDVAYAILQSRSPSCGVKEIYDGSFSGRLVEGKGIFARLLEENGIRAVDVEDMD